MRGGVGPVSSAQIVWTVVIVVAALVLLGLLAVSMRRRSRADDKARAEELREQAGRRAAADLPAAEARARQAEARAEQARLAAERAEERAEAAELELAQQRALHEDRVRAADRLDPDVDHRAEDYAPQTGATEPSRPGRHSAAPSAEEEVPEDGDQEPAERNTGGSHRA